MNFKKRLQSFAWAVNGILYAIKTQWNVKFHLFATLAVLASGFYFQIEKWEWCVVLLCCALVISLELLNTAIETLADKLHPEHDKLIGLAKDVSAGATLIASIFVAMVGLLVFLPHFMNGK